MEGGTEDSREEKGCVDKNTSNYSHFCLVIPILCANIISSKVGIPMSDTFDITQEWLAGLDKNEDGIAVDTKILVGLKERGSAIRRELKGEVLVCFVIFSLISFTVLLFIG